MEDTVNYASAAAKQASFDYEIFRRMHSARQSPTNVVVATFRAIPAGKALKVVEGGKTYVFMNRQDLLVLPRTGLTPFRANIGQVLSLGGVAVFDLDQGAATDKGRALLEVYARKMHRG